MTLNPLLLNIPEQFESERLIIRAAMPGDGAAHLAALQESIGDLRRYLGFLPWVKVEPSFTVSEAYCREYRSKFIARQDLLFFLFAKEDGALVGNIGLHRIDWTIPKVEIGYWCRTSAQGKGLTLEAVRAMTDFAFTQLAAQRIEIRADAQNTASWRVAEKAGYTLEGTLRHASRDVVSGALCDLRVYAKIV